MHRALQIPELVNNAFRLLDKKSLVAVATTCTLFSEIALDIIWEDLPSLFPLLRCIPKDALQLISSRKPWVGKFSTVTLARSTTPADFVQCRKYTHRIKKLMVGDWKLPTEQFSVDPSLLEVMSVSRMFVFPRLRELRWEETPPDCFRHSHMFLVPQLTSLAVTHVRSARSQSPPPLLITFIDSIPYSCPGLSSLSLNIFDPHTSIDDVLLRILPGLTGLEKLTVPRRLPASTFNALSSSTCLKSLTFSLAQGTMDPADCNLHASSFCSLRVLDVKVDSLSIVTTLFTTCSMTALRSLKVTVQIHGNVGPDESDLRDLFKALARSCCTNELFSITLRAAGQYDDQSIAVHPSRTITATALEPLFSFQRMRTLLIDLPYLFNINGRVLEKMAQSWPKLHSLAIEGDVSKEWMRMHKPVLKVDDLLHLVRNCPRLSRLAVCLDTTVRMSTGGPRPGGGASCPSFAALSVGRTQIEGKHVIGLANFFSDIFPGTFKILTKNMEDKELWVEVLNVHQGMVIVRAQERYVAEGGSTIGGG